MGAVTGGVAGFDCGDAVLLALGASDVAVAAAVGHAPEFLHVDVDEIAGAPVFVAAYSFAGGAVDVGEPIEVAACQDGVHG